MPDIQILSPHLADLIAAGEVVERPASVVKELVENAFDAGARTVTVELRGGGATYLRVTDDGCGMAPEDAGIAFLRHATSKLHDEQGLEAIGTMGFRGEALAAISAVSHITLTTRQRGAASGTHMTLDAGDIQDMYETGCPEGTTMIVRDLFFNTPARRKFLKSDRAEGAACAAAALRCALGRPDVSVRCIRDGEEVFFSPGDNKLDSCVYSLLGRDLAMSLLPCEGESDGARVHGFISSPAAGRGSRAQQYFFCNGRWIRSAALQAALEQAYRNTLLVGRFPACVLYVELSCAAVDVNVHPAKTEVKFTHERAVFDAVYYGARAALEAEKAPVTTLAKAAAGKRVVMVRIETSPEDLAGMAVAEGILTARGGMTSHAAVVARGMGKCCVSGAGALNIDYKNRTVEIDGVVLKEGDYISLNGSTGVVYNGKVETQAAELSGDFAELMTLADKYTRLQVRTNADTPHDAEVARNFGAVGIGLCRTEHMFFEGEKIKAMREMILAENAEGRRKALAKILPYQQEDFKGIFKAMAGCPVTVRLLDPPLHEFVPHDLKGQQEMADTMGVSLQYIQQRVESLCEHNPMLGHRGCRLGNTYPEITQMQTRAILGAALELKKEGVETHPEIMVPLTGILYEFKEQENVIRAEAKKLFEEVGDSIDFKVGTMIEIPRAALTADRIASSAEFFSFGTNDLTQMTFGYSRDDIASFLPVYLEKKILKVDPFQVLDQNGVGQLVRMATEKGRAIRPDLKCGICGEHGGEPSSVKFCHRVGLNYVSCSPFRVPIARLAAAQAAIEG